MMIYIVKHIYQYQADSMQGSICYDDKYKEFYTLVEAREFFDECMKNDDVVGLSMYECQRID